jgi:hypothetical protein
MKTVNPKTQHSRKSKESDAVLAASPETDDFSVERLAEEKILAAETARIVDGLRKAFHWQDSGETGTISSHNDEYLERITFKNHHSSDGDTRTLTAIFPGIKIKVVSGLSGKPSFASFKGKFEEKYQELEGVNAIKAIIITLTPRLPAEHRDVFLNRFTPTSVSAAGR